MNYKADEDGNIQVEMSRAEAFEAIQFLTAQLTDEDNQLIKYTAFNDED